MRSIILLALPALLLFSACKKEKNPPKEPEENVLYINVLPSSSWVYQEINNSGAAPVQSEFTLTSTNRDTSIHNKSYHIYTFSNGDNRYLNLSGKDYYEFGNLPGTGAKSFERLFLKSGAPEGSSWSQSETLEVEGIQIPVKLTNTIISTSLTKEVQGKNYDKVIHIKSTITSDLLPGTSLTTDINSYYAPNYGLIENTSKLNLDYMGMVEKVDISTTLKSADLK